MSTEVINGIVVAGSATIGAIIGAFLNSYYAKKNMRSELTLTSSAPSRLVEISKNIAPRVEILVDGKKVNKVVSSEISIVNTGNMSIHDVNVKVIIHGTSELVSIEIERTNFSYNEEDIITSIKDTQTVELMMKYLNPNDELIGRLLFTDKPDSVEINFRKPEVRSIIKNNYVPEMPSVIAQELFTAMSESSKIVNTAFKLLSPEYRKYIEAKKIINKD